MRTRIAHAALALFVGATGTAMAQGQSDLEINPNKVQHRVNPWGVTSDAPTAGSTGQMTPAISWHGGPVIGGAPNVHLIWYGNWNQANGSDTPAGQQIIRDLVGGLGGSSHLQINIGYTGSGSTSVTANLGTMQESNFGYISGTRAKRLRDSDIKSIVTNYINSHGGAQSNAVYFVLTSSDVNETSGFCTQYCGWHTNGAINGVDVKYSFVGNANRCLSGCAAQSVGPNGNAGVDGMASVMTHELEEALSDPDLNAWYDSNGAENADKCAWTFGSAQGTASNGASYNVTLTNPANNVTRNFLLQRNLKASDSKCYVNSAGQQ